MQVRDFSIVMVLLSIFAVIYLGALLAWAFPLGFAMEYFSNESLQINEAFSGFRFYLLVIPAFVLALHYFTKSKYVQLVYWKDGLPGLAASLFPLGHIGPTTALVILLGMKTGQASGLALMPSMLWGGVFYAFAFSMSNKGVESVEAERKEEGSSNPPNE